MDLLEIPTQDLLFRYSLTATAGPLWTLAAFLAAALGLWRIRAIGHKSDSSPAPTPPPSPSPPPSESKPDPPRVPAKLLTPTCHVDAVGSPKARFTVCYSYETRHVDYDYCDDDDELGEEEGRGKESDGVVDGEGEVMTTAWGEWGCDWMAVRRKGDLGWYSYQERTALNGSVVRLWGKGSGLTASSRRELSL